MTHEGLSQKAQSVLANEESGTQPHVGPIESKLEGNPNLSETAKAAAEPATSPEQQARPRPRFGGAIAKPRGLGLALGAVAESEDGVDLNRRPLVALVAAKQDMTLAPTDEVRGRFRGPQDIDTPIFGERDGPPEVRLQTHRESAAALSRTGQGVAALPGRVDRDLAHEVVLQKNLRGGDPHHVGAITLSLEGKGGARVEPQHKLFALIEAPVVADDEASLAKHGGVVNFRLHRYAQFFEPFEALRRCSRQSRGPLHPPEEDDERSGMEEAAVEHKSLTTFLRTPDPQLKKTGKPPRKNGRRYPPRVRLWGLSRVTTLIAASALGCDPPAASELPPTELVGPSPPAANTCVPPYARFANDAFLWADLDRGRSCTVYLEQDECVLGVFRDAACGGDEREWRGIIDGEDRIRLGALYPPGTAGLLPRSPRCCNGLLRRDDDIPPSSQLACQMRECGNPADADHLGIRLERMDETVDRLQVVEETRLPGPIVDGHGQLALVSGQSETADGVWSLDGGSPNRVRALRDGRHLAEGGGRIWVATDEVVEGFGRSLATAEGISGLIGTPEGVVYVDAGDVIHFRPDADDDEVARATPPDAPPFSLAVDGGSGKIFAVARSSVTTFNLGLDLIETHALSRTLPRAPEPEGQWRGERIAVVAGCHEVAERDHCVWRIDPSSGSVDRVAIPDVQRLGAPAEAGSLWWVPDTAAVLHVVDPSDGVRLTDRLSLPGPAGYISPADRSGRHRVLERAGSRVWTVEAAGGRG